MKSRESFDTAKKPIRPRPYLMPVEWVGSAGFLLAKKGKITKHRCEDLKPPYLLLSNHASFVDFPMTVKAIFPHRCAWVISIEEFVGREWLFRNIGGIYKRKFTSDLSVVRHILHVLKTQKQICTMYPEARYSLAGINEQLDVSLGKLIKIAKCPVVVMIEHGNYLCSPQWCKKPERKVPVCADFTQIVTREEAESLPADEIQRRIEEAFVYDEYRWQLENRIEISAPNRADKIHRILYQCPHCGREFSMNSSGADLWCEACGRRWEMDVYGQLHCKNGEDIFPFVSDWYRWEREQVRQQVENGTYHFEDDVRLEHLVNAGVGFEPVGTVHMTHDANGFVLRGNLNNGEPFELHRTVISMYSCHIEYDFKHRGDAIDICNLTDTWFVFPLTARNCLTKIHFATEELYKKQKREMKEQEALAKAAAAERKREEAVQPV